MSKYVFKGEIKGDGHQFGDNFYGNACDFIKISKKEFSEIETKLIELIFDYFQSEEEKKNLLVSLNSLSDDPEKNRSQVPVWKKFINHLSDIGLKEVAETVINYVKDRIPDTNSIQL